VLTWKPPPPGPNDLLRYIAESDGHDYRIFDDPETGQPGRPWVLAIRRLGTVDALLHLTDHATPDEAKRAAQVWKGPLGGSGFR
jgi:hypothetical protein